MKKLVLALTGIGLAVAFAGTLYYLWRKAQRPPAVYETVAPVTADIVKKTVATGSVVPRREVAIKPQVSGIIEEMHVKPGDTVASGAPIARIRIIPDMVTLSGAESRVNLARIALDQAARELERHKELHRRQVVSDQILQEREVAAANAREELTAAADNLDLIRKGTTARSSAPTNTIVRATISGTVLEVPLEPGSSVIESNTFNEGTTLATIADMGELIFKGKVDESEVGKLKTGMDLVLTIGALEGQTFPATLEHIAPKGVAQEGAIQFEIRAALAKTDGTLIRANLSANADIVLARAEKVLAVNEGLLLFENGSTFVEVETAPQKFEKRKVETGLSDGTLIEIKGGIAKDDKLKGAVKTGAKGAK